MRELVLGAGLEDRQQVGGSRDLSAWAPKAPAATASPPEIGPRRQEESVPWSGVWPRAGASGRPELALPGRAAAPDARMDYASKRCVPCEGGVPALTPAQVDAALPSLRGWEAKEDHTRLRKQLRFADFKAAMRFVNAMADLAEAEGHHPDFAVHYDTVDVTLWTHAVGGLSENDLILAAKLDRLVAA